MQTLRIALLLMARHIRRGERVWLVWTIGSYSGL